MADDRITMETDLTAWTDEQLLTLTDEELQRAIDVECARRGIPLLPDIAVPRPKLEMPEATVTVYVLTSGYGCSLEFNDAAAAEDVAQAIRAAAPKRVSTSSRGYGTGPTYVDGSWQVLPVKIETRHALSAEAWASVESETKRIEKLQEEWDAAEKVRKNIANQRQEVDEELSELVNLANRRARERTEAQAKFVQYLGVADNDRLMALRFMAHAGYEHHIRAAGLWDEYQRAMDDTPDGRAARLLVGRSQRAQAVNEEEVAL